MWISIRCDTDPDPESKNRHKRTNFDICLFKILIFKYFFLNYSFHHYFWQIFGDCCLLDDDLDPHPLMPIRIQRTDLLLMRISADPDPHYCISNI